MMSKCFNDAYFSSISKRKWEYYNYNSGFIGAILHPSLNIFLMTFSVRIYSSDLLPTAYILLKKSEWISFESTLYGHSGSSHFCLWTSI